MLYAAIDIETTGLNHRCDIIQFAAVLDNLADPQPLRNLPRFQAYFIKSAYVGEPYALAMHASLFQQIAEAQQKGLTEDADGNKYMPIEALPAALEQFLADNEVTADVNGKYRITVAGKNVGAFDIPFLNQKIQNWGNVVFHYRCIDPGTLYLKPTDVFVPDLATCLQRAGVSKSVAHVALADALDVVQLIRHKFSEGSKAPTGEEVGTW